MPAVRIKDQWREQRLFDQRSLVCAAIMGLGVLGLIVRLFVLQVARHEYYSELSQGNRVRNEPIPAARGLILDRHGEVIAGNQPAYQLELVPEEVPDVQQDRKSTRLNSSHGYISYAVFCLKKTKQPRHLPRTS